MLKSKSVQARRSVDQTVRCSNGQSTHTESTPSISASGLSSGPSVLLRRRSSQARAMATARGLRSRSVLASGVARSNLGRCGGDWTECHPGPRWLLCRGPLAPLDPRPLSRARRRPLARPRFPQGSQNITGNSPPEPIPPGTHTVLRRGRRRDLGGAMAAVPVTGQPWRGAAGAPPRPPHERRPGGREHLVARR